MKLLIFSDSHGYFPLMKEAVRREQPDRIVHLGDYFRGGRKLRPIREPYRLAGDGDRVLGGREALFDPRTFAAGEAKPAALGIDGPGTGGQCGSVRPLPQPLLPDGAGGAAVQSRDLRLQCRDLWPDDPEKGKLSR